MPYKKVARMPAGWNDTGAFALTEKGICLLQAVREMSIEDIALLCELAKRMPRKEELKR